MQRTTALVTFTCLVSVASCGNSPPRVAAPPHAPTGADALELGATTLVSSSESDADNAVIDAHRIYWSAGTDLRSAPRAGGPAVTLAAGVGEIWAMTADDDSLYVVTRGDGANEPKGSGRLLRIAKAGGAPVVLVSGLVDPGGVAVAGDDVFYTHAVESIDFNVTTGQVLAVAKAGGAPRVIADHQAYPTDVAADATHVYWIDYGGTDTVLRAPRAGGAAQVLAHDLGTPSGLALAGDRVLVGTTTGGVVAVAKTGGAPTVLYPGAVMAVAADADGIVFRTGTGLIFRGTEDGAAPRVVAMDDVAFYEPLAIDGAEVVWGNRTSNAVNRAPRAGGLLEVGEIANEAGPIAVDGDDVFWLDDDQPCHADVCSTPQPDTLERAPRGGGPTTTLASVAGDLTALAVDGDTIYIADAEGGAILAVPRRGGPTRTVASAQHGPGIVVAGGGAVIWSDADGAIWRVSGPGAPPARLGVAHAPVVALALDGVDLYVAEGGGRIWQTSTAGGGPATIADGQVGLGPMVAGADGLTWAADGAVWHAPRGGAPARIGPIGAGRVSGIARVGASTYVLLAGADGSSGALLELPDAGTATTLVAAIGTSAGLAADRDGLYWTSAGHRAVLRRAR